MGLLIPADEDVTLRLLEPQHAEEVFAVVDAHRDHLGRWLPWVETSRSPTDTAAFAEQSLRHFAERKALTLSVLERGAVVGGAGWTQWRSGESVGVTRGSADIGYWLAEDAQGRGIMTRAVRRIVDLASHEYGLWRLTIQAEPANARSCAVAERLGFQLEGTMHRVCRWGDRWVDHRLYSLLAGGSPGAT